MRRVADILAEELARQGLRQVFMLTGGGAMHLNDAFGRCKDLQIFSITMSRLAPWLLKVIAVSPGFPPFSM